MSLTTSSTDTSSSVYKKAQRQYLKSTSNRSKDVELNWTPFRAAEKKYKARFPPPDLSQVLDVAILDDARTDEVARGKWRGSVDAVDYRELRLKVPGGQKAYIVPRIPGAKRYLFHEDVCIHFRMVTGLVVLPSFVSSGNQKRLVRWALCDQARNNETNLNAHYILPQDGLWNTYIRSTNSSREDVLIQPSALIFPEQATPEVPGPRQLVTNTPASPETFPSLSSSPKPPPSPSPTVQPSSCSALVRKLRWANIGWSYHWGTKQYDFAKGKGTVSPEIRDICRSAVELVDWHGVFGDSSERDAEWGPGGPDWQTWTETYGSMDLFSLSKLRFLTASIPKNLMQGLSIFTKQTSELIIHCRKASHADLRTCLGHSNGAC
jgi:alkylated DNA repair protein alkB homolog 1